MVLRWCGSMFNLVDKPVKINDHCMDALRYSVMKLKDKNKISGAAKNIGI